jgi:hypothetical protein
MWQSMSIDEYAHLEGDCGATIQQYGPVWWRRVRPFLYRPLDPFEPTSCDVIRHHLGPMTAVQHPVSDPESANSFYSLIVFDQLNNYCVENLHKHHRRYLREAVRNGIDFKRLLNGKDISDGLHDTYLAFYQRSKYTFSKNRLDRKHFNNWIACHLNQPKTEVTVAFHQNMPVGIYIACLLGDTLIWKTAVNSPLALKLRVPDLILHQYHERTRKQPEIKRIYCGFYSGNSGLDTFKLRRGAKIVTLPTHLRIHPCMLRLFRTFHPSAYQNLIGFTPEQIQTITAE